MARAATPTWPPGSPSTTRSSFKNLQQQPKQQQQHPDEQHHRPQLLAFAAGLVSTLLWCCASSALILMNNDLYKGGFPFPMMVTGLGQLFSAVAGLMMAAVGATPLRTPPSSLSEMLHLAPIVACTACTMFLGNKPYMYLSLSFIQILKAFTPALTLVVGAAAGVERMTTTLVASVLLIAIGTGGAVLAESGAPSYSVYGLVLFMGSSLTEAGRVVCSQLLLGPYKYSSVDGLVYVGIPSAAVLISGSLIFERQQGLFEAFQVLLPAKAWTFVQAGVMSGLVNLTSYLAISTTSSLTFKVSGCLKNLAVVWYGVVMHGDSITARHLLGYAVSLAGFAIYTYSRQGKVAQVASTAAKKSA